MQYYRIFLSVLLFYLQSSIIRVDLKSMYRCFTTENVKYLTRFWNIYFTIDIIRVNFLVIINKLLTKCVKVFKSG